MMNPGERCRTSEERYLSASYSERAGRLRERRVASHPYIASKCNAPELRFSVTLGEEPEVELTLV